MTGLLKKAGLGIALAATALTTAAPANAQRWGHHRYYGHHGGDVAAGALLGGIVGLGIGAAIASNDRPYYYDRGYDRGYAYDPYYAQPRGYYYNSYDYRRPRCWVESRWDPYYGGRVRTRVCR